MKEVELLEILEHFSEEEQNILFGRVIELDATHIILAENNNMNSSQFGQKTAMLVGGKSSYTFEELDGKHLNDLPSQRQYFTKYAKVEICPNKIRIPISKINKKEFAKDTIKLIEKLENGEISEEDFCQEQKTIERRYGIYEYKRD